VRRLEKKQKVEKCGICGQTFEFNDVYDAIGFVQTDYLVPDSFVSGAINVLSETSKVNRTGISIICVKCADHIDEIRNTKMPFPEIKYIHDFQDGLYRAFPVSKFQKVSSQVQRQIKREVESNSLYCFGKN
jgi:hypothetical protein